MQNERAETLNSKPKAVQDGGATLRVLLIFTHP